MELAATPQLALPRALGTRSAPRPATLLAGTGPRQAPRPTAASQERPDALPISLVYAYAYNTPLPEAELSARTSNTLRKVNILAIKQFCAVELRDLRWLRNFEKKSVEEVKAYRKRLGVPMNQSDFEISRQVVETPYVGSVVIQRAC